ncbi:MAG: transketolase [Legionellales bacterium]|nr:transketolase [Legionellales bacterium]
MISELELSNAVRILSVDAITRANSGHPGMPCGMADIATVLWRKFINHNPKNPQFFNRDRFILSNGHGSMLLYSILHLTGYNLSLEEIKNFRQLGSMTPGHPEYKVTPGVETTTGPLGQGLSNAVGMSIAEKHLASIFNKPDIDIVNHYTYAFVGDGCLMEGISHEVASLAGTLKLNKLIVFYDDNNISIDGNISGWFTEDIPKRFEAYGWHVIPKVDGHNHEAIYKAIESAKKIQDKPILICCQTIIGFGSPNYAGSAKSHGAPFNKEEVDKIREKLGWKNEPFQIPKEITNKWDHTNPGKQIEDAWLKKFDEYKNKYPELAKEFQRRMNNQLPKQWHDFKDKMLAEINTEQKNIATRKSSNLCIEYLNKFLPELMGGSADLTCSNLTSWKEAIPFTASSPHGRYLNYGVREFGMSGIMNGLALHGGIIPYAGTFLVFSDYARNAIRLAALMEIKVIFVLTHDSIGLGEDGPTHQPVEHIASLRLIPNLKVWRPCDSVESTIAWQQAIENPSPSALLFSRQTLKCHTRTKQQLKDIEKGGYILRDSDDFKVIVIATGSEVEIATSVYEELLGELNIRVVSMPCVEVFKEQDKEYQNKILPPSIKNRVVIEAGSSNNWHEFVDSTGKIISLNEFGKSANYKSVYNYYNINSFYLKENILSFEN